MKKSKSLKFIFLSLLLSIATLPLAAKVKKVENPLVDKTNTANLFIDAIELSPDSTTVTLHTYNYMNGRINIQPGVKLVYDGKDYPVRNAIGIELGKKITIPSLGDTIFSLSFDPLPMKAKTFDFIEGDDDKFFRLEGIHTDKTVDSQPPIEMLNELQAQKWEKGTATLKGHVLNYQPDGEQTSVQVYPRSALGRMIDKNIGVTNVNSDGSFEVELPVFQSNQPCFFTAPGFYGLIYLSPDKESYVTIDQSQRWGNGHQGKDGSVVFTGANDELNNQLALNIGHDMVWDSFSNNTSRDKKYSSTSEYKEAVLHHTANRKEKIRKLPFSPTMKHLMNIQIDSDALIVLNDRFTLRQAGDINPSYYDFYNEIDLDNLELMWASGFDSFINFAYNPFVNNSMVIMNDISPEYYSYLINNNIATGEDAELANKLISYNLDSVPKDVVDEYAKTVSERVIHYSDSLLLKGEEKDKAQKLINRLNNGEMKKFNDVTSYYISWLLQLSRGGHQLSLIEATNVPFDNEVISGITRFNEDNDSIISAFHSRYEENYEDWKFEKGIDTAIDNFTCAYGKDSPLMQQLLAMQAYMTHIEKRNTLNDRQIANSRKRLSDIMFDYLMAQNDEMAKVLANAKSNILEINPNNSGEQVLKDIAEKYKGKVIYIDIWATWCSPCLNAITELQPEKKNYADDVVFVYLADESSPKKAWEEKIKSIDGEHMRLSQTQMQELMSKFAFNGYPSYIVIAKDGSVAHAGFLHGLDNIKTLLNTEIAK